MARLTLSRHAGSPTSHWKGAQELLLLQGASTPCCRGIRGRLPFVAAPVFLGHLSLCKFVFGFVFLLTPHPPYITSCCPSTILNCCVHPASSRTLSVISLAAPGEGYCRAAVFVLITMSLSFSQRVLLL